MVSIEGRPQFFNLINGERRGSAQHHQVVDPRTEETLWDAPIATPQDLDDAIVAAQEAFKEWRETTLAERHALLVRMAGVATDNAAELTEILMRETGKSRMMASSEVQKTAGQCMIYSQLGLEDEIAHEDDTRRVVATHVPLGVVGAICPWNFPLILSSLKMLCALVMGNCVVVKPSPFTPYAVLRLVELWAPLFPHGGVLQAVNGGADLGAALTAHPGIAKISFTGTIATGKRVMAACAKTLKRVTLELAGNDAAVVCADADLDLAATQTAMGAFFNAGQMCVATKRVYVHESVYDEFLQKFLAETRKTWGISEDAGEPSLFGPVSNQTQLHALNNVLEDLRARGANIIEGGQKHKGKGLWLPPTVVDQPPEESLLVQEEQFGPVIPILKWSSEDDVLRRANLDNAGLGASVYSQDQENAERIARRLEAGSVWINASERPNPSVYFGGVKDSGFGGEMGRQGLLSYCYTKCLYFSKL